MDSGLAASRRPGMTTEGNLARRANHFALSESRQAPPAKIISFRFSENYGCLHSSRLGKRGVSADRHQTRSGMRWTRCAQRRSARRGRRNRAVPIPRRWDQALRDEREATVARKPGAPRRPRISRNPLRRERRLSRLPCRCLRAQKCISFARKTRGCGQHPVFPAPSLIERDDVVAKLGQIVPREREGVPTPSAVVPANAGTHNHREELCGSASAIETYRQTPRYGSRVRGDDSVYCGRTTSSSPSRISRRDTPPALRRARAWGRRAG